MSETVEQDDPRRLTPEEMTALREGVVHAPTSICPECGKTELVLNPNQDGIDFHCGRCGVFVFN